MKQIGVGTFRATARMKELVNDVLDTNRISYGPYCRRFEQVMADIHNAKFGVLSNSGTSALHVGLQAMKEKYEWKDGSIVLVPSITFVASVNVVLHNNLKPVLVDINPITYNIDESLLLEKLNEHYGNVVAVMPVHLFGMMANMSAIANVIDKYNSSTSQSVRIIEDSCECMFAQQDGNYPGRFSDIACFSMYVAHLITTGVGGLSLTNDPDLASCMRSLVNHGRDGIYISIDDDQDTDNLKEIISRRFRFDRIGHSFRITEIEAALGLAQLETYQMMIARRQENASSLTNYLSHLSKPLQLPYIPDGFTHSFMMYPIVVRTSDWSRDDLTNHLENDGIETRGMLPLTNQPAYDGLWNREDYPVAAWVNRSGFYIGCHQDLVDEDLRYIADSFTSFFKG